MVHTRKMYSDLNESLVAHDHPEKPKKTPTKNICYYSDDIESDCESERESERDDAMEDNEDCEYHENSIRKHDLESEKYRMKRLLETLKNAIEYAKCRNGDIVGTTWDEGLMMMTNARRFFEKRSTELNAMKVEKKVTEKDEDLFVYYSPDVDMNEVLKRFNVDQMERYLFVHPEPNQDEIDKVQKLYDESKERYRNYVTDKIRHMLNVVDKINDKVSVHMETHERVLRRAVCTHQMYDFLIYFGRRFMNHYTKFKNTSINKLEELSKNNPNEFDGNFYRNNLCNADMSKLIRRNKGVKMSETNDE